MYLLAAILMFIFGAIGAAKEGDYSGIGAIGRVLMGIGVFFIFGCIITGFSSDGSGDVFVFAIVIAVLGGFMIAKEVKT